MNHAKNSSHESTSQPSRSRQILIFLPLQFLIVLRSLLWKITLNQLFLSNCKESRDLLDYGLQHNLPVREDIIHSLQKNYCLKLSVEKIPRKVIQSFFRFTTCFYFTLFLLTKCSDSTNGTETAEVYVNDMIYDETAITSNDSVWQDSCHPRQ